MSPCSRESFSSKLSSKLFHLFLHGKFTDQLLQVHRKKAYAKLIHHHARTCFLQISAILIHFETLLMKSYLNKQFSNPQNLHLLPINVINNKITYVDYRKSKIAMNGIIWKQFMSQAVNGVLHIISHFCKSTIWNETMLFQEYGVSERIYNALL